MTARIADDFARTVAAGGLGTAVLGGVITAVNGNTRMSVDGSKALLISTATGQTTRAAYDAATPAVDFDETVLLSLSVLPTGANVCHVRLIGRSTGTWGSSENHYSLRLDFLVSSVRLTVQKKVANVETTVGTANVTQAGITPVAGGGIWLRFQGRGIDLRGKCWLSGTAEPAGWGISRTDVDLSGTGRFALSYYSDSAGAATVTVDDFSAIDLQEAAPAFAEVMTWADWFAIDKTGAAPVGFAQTILWSDTISVAHNNPATVAQTFTWSDTFAVNRVNPAAAIVETMTWADAIAVQRVGGVAPLVEPCSPTVDYRRADRRSYWQ